MTSVRLTSLVALALLTPACSSAPSVRPAPDPGADSAPTLDLDAALSAWAEVERHRGVSAAVIFPDGTEWVAAAGIEAEGVPLRPDHLIWIASVTKTVTGAVVLQLAQEGALGLDDPVSDWLPPHPHVDPPITIRELLNHTNGLGNYTANPELSARIASDPTHQFTPGELIDLIPEPAFIRGERTQYTNSAFLLLGRIAEEATGTPLPDLWRTRLFEPLGLDDPFLPGVQEPTGPVATAWAGRADLSVPPLSRMSLVMIGSYAFGLHANAHFMARWGRALFTSDLLTPEMRAEMTRLLPAAGNIPGETGVGLGIRGYGYLNRTQWGHSGGSPLGSSLMLFDPETGITVAVVMNQGAGADHFTLAPRLLDIASRQLEHR